jgi:hypothetical protein
LQQQGTRSVTRRVVGIAGRGRRLKQGRNHQVSRQIVAAFPHSLIGLEELTAIRERTQRKHGTRASASQTASSESACRAVGVRGGAGSRGP